MSKQADLLRLADNTRAVEREFVDGLPDHEQKRLGAPDDWSAKDLLAHLAAWRRRGADDLAAERRGEETEEITDFDPVNRETFQAHRDLPWDDVVRQSQQAWGDLRQSLTSLDAEQLESRGPSGTRPPLWRRAVVEVASHPVTHLAEFALQHGRGDDARRWMDQLLPRLLALEPDPAWHGVVHYNRACHLAQAGRVEPALTSLETALNLRPDLKEWAGKDPDLAPLRQEPRFPSIVATG